MKRNVLIICLLTLTLLCGCGFSQNTADPAAAESAAPENAAVTPEETPEPEPTPTPVPELAFPDGTTHMADETSLI